MNQRQIASVLFTVLGLYMFLDHILELPVQLLIFVQTNPDQITLHGLLTGSRAVSVAIISAVLYSACGAAIVYCRVGLARQLFPDRAVKIEGYADFLDAAIAVIGAYFIVDGVRRALQPSTDRWPAVAQIIVATAIFLGARTIAGVWRRFQPTSGDPS